MSEYTGTDNLEVMSAAVNYNHFLSQLITEQTAKTDLILDFGAGIGTFAQKLHAAGYSVCCIETDNKQANHIRKLGITAYLDIEELEDASLDYIYTLNVLEHIDDDQQAIHQLHNKLKPGGRLMIYVPAMQVLFSHMDQKVGHFRRYSKSSLTQLIRQTDLKIKKCNYVDSAGFFATLLYKLIGNQTGDINRSALIFYDRYLFPLSRMADRLFDRLFGKNLYLLAEKPPAKKIPR